MQSFAWNVAIVTIYIINGYADIKNIINAPCSNNKKCDNNRKKCDNNNGKKNRGDS